MTKENFLREVERLLPDIDITVWSKDIGNIADILGREIALRK